MRRRIGHAQCRRIAPNGLLPAALTSAHRSETLNQDLVLVEFENDVGQPPALLALEGVAVRRGRLALGIVVQTRS